MLYSTETWISTDRVMSGGDIVGGGDDDGGPLGHGETVAEETETAGASANDAATRAP